MLPMLQLINHKWSSSTRTCMSSNQALRERYNWWNPGIRSPFYNNWFHHVSPLFLAKGMLHSRNNLLDTVALCLTTIPCLLLLQELSLLLYHPLWAMWMALPTGWSQIHSQWSMSHQLITAAIFQDNWWIKAEKTVGVTSWFMISSCWQSKLRGFWDKSPVENSFLRSVSNSGISILVARETYTELWSFGHVKALWSTTCRGTLWLNLDPDAYTLVASITIGWWRYFNFIPLDHNLHIWLDPC